MLSVRNDEINFCFNFDPIDSISMNPGLLNKGCAILCIHVIPV